MQEKKNHINFTAADIEQYHKGLLSAKQRHALEKAALDDPFLADALEGYANAGVDVNEDIAELKKRLEARVDDKKIIPITSVKDRSSFNWLKIAAMIIVIAGTGLLVYQFAFNNSSKNIAQLDSKKNEETTATDSTNTMQPATTTPNEYNNGSPVIELKQKSKGIKIDDRTTSTEINKQSTGAGTIKKDTAYSTDIKNPSIPVASPESNDEKNVTVKVSNRNDAKLSPVDDGRRNNVQNAKPREGFALNESINTNRKQENQANVFRGRITDPNNNPLPFANITNRQDNVGTYSDAKGYFNLISPDSVLDVQVRSIGFENSNARLRNDLSNNQVVLQEDQKLSDIVISNKKPNVASRSRSSNVKLEEPEPADGWDNYDTYLVNNLNMPDEIKTKKSRGDVEVSFEVDKNGEPINLKVEKSLCSKCDEEAIRLIKEGPKWKRKDKRSRTKVTVPF